MRPCRSLAATLAVAICSFHAVCALSPPICQAVAPQQNNLTEVLTGYVNVTKPPFGLAYATNQKHIAFVTLDKTNDSTLGVLDTSTFIPTLIHQIAIPVTLTGVEGALGLTLTRDGRHLFVAAGPGAVIIDTALAATGSADSIVGALNGTTATQTPGTAAIEVTLTKNDKYAFVSQEYGVIARTQGRGNIDVFELHKHVQNGSITGTPVGSISLGFAVVGTALSKDESLLYALSETTTANDTTPGFLSVLDVEKLKTDPANALLGNVPAGCGPVRVIVSKDGCTVWVTARESNHLLAFDAAKLVQDPDDALIASVQVGTSPVGLTFARHESLILTADSNRFEYKNATSGLSVVDVKMALAGDEGAVLGRVPTGLFPREFATSPNGSTILVADYDSDQVQAVDVATLPKAS